MPSDVIRNYWQNRDRLRRYLRNAWRLLRKVFISRAFWEPFMSDDQGEEMYPAKLIYRALTVKNLISFHLTKWSTDISYLFFLEGIWIKNPPESYRIVPICSRYHHLYDDPAKWFLIHANRIGIVRAYRDTPCTNRVFAMWWVFENLKISYVWSRKGSQTRARVSVHISKRCQFRTTKGYQIATYKSQLYRL